MDDILAFDMTGFGWFPIVINSILLVVIALFLCVCMLRILRKQVRIWRKRK